MQFYFEGEKGLETLKNQADSFICSVLPDSPYHQIYLTPGFSPLPFPPQDLKLVSIYFFQTVFHPNEFKHIFIIPHHLNV